jgi:RNA polymerase sigma-70 factor (ECF subfamily)
MKQTPKFDELVGELQGKLHTLAYSILLSHDEAMDVVQDSFIKAWQQEHFFDDEFNQKAWLFKVVRNLSLNRRRSVMRLFNWVKKQACEPEQEQQNVIDSLIKQEQLQTLEKTLTQLSLQDREVLGLYYSAGNDCSQIAEIIGVAKGTVMSRLARARERLSKELSKENADA